MKTKENEITLFKLLIIYGSIIVIGIIIISLILYKPIDPKVIGYDENEALVLIYTHTNLTILDVRSNQSHFNYSHIRGAVWLNHTLRGKTNDIIIYNKDGSSIERIANSLSTVNEGKIYFIIGGLESWEKAGYPVNRRR